MFAVSAFSGRTLRVLGVSTALLMGTTFAGNRAEALSPINPGLSKAENAVAGELTIEVRGGGHGGGGGGHGGGFGGGHGFAHGGFGSGGFGGGHVRGGTIGARPSIVAAPAAGAMGPRFAGHHFFHHHRHFGGVFIGGVYYDDPYDYPGYYDYPPVDAAPAFVPGAGCRRVMTAHGPRVVCHGGARHHHIHRRHHRHRHHRA